LGARAINLRTRIISSAIAISVAFHETSARPHVSIAGAILHGPVWLHSAKNRIGSAAAFATLLAAKDFASLGNRGYRSAFTQEARARMRDEGAVAISSEAARIDRAVGHMIMIVQIARAIMRAAEVIAQFFTIGHVTASVTASEILISDVLRVSGRAKSSLHTATSR
jgi:hypothetical protein